MRKSQTPQALMKSPWRDTSGALRRQWVVAVAMGTSIVLWLAIQSNPSQYGSLTRVNWSSVNAIGQTHKGQEANARTQKGRELKKHINNPSDDEIENLFRIHFERRDNTSIHRGTLSKSSRNLTQSQMRISPIEDPFPVTAHGSFAPPTPIRQIVHTQAIDEPMTSANLSIGRRRRRHIGWWNDEKPSQIHSEIDVYISPNESIIQTLTASPDVKVLNLNVERQAMELDRALGQFDPTLIAEISAERLDQPTGSNLDAGATIDRLKQNTLDSTLGIRKRNQYGGTWELTQEMNLFESNSEFLRIDEQGGSRLSLSLNQPLLRNSGVRANDVPIVVAARQMDASFFQTKLQTLDIAEEAVGAYWELVAARSSLVILEHSVEDLRRLRSIVQERNEVDITPDFDASISSAVSRQETDATLARTRLIEAQANLVRLLGKTDLLAYSFQLVPEALSLERKQYQFSSEIDNAIRESPLLQSISAQIDAARELKFLAENQARPNLDLQVQLASSGLNSEFQVGRSLGDQFSEGAPTVGVGLAFELPTGNRVARANDRQRSIELQQLLLQHESAQFRLATDVRISIDRYNNSYRSYVNTCEQIESIQRELTALYDRLPIALGFNKANFGLLFTRIIQVERRLVEAELSAVRLSQEIRIDQGRVERLSGRLVSIQQEQLVYE